MKLILISVAVLSIAGCGGTNYQSDPADMAARAAMISAWPGVHTAPVPFYPMQTQPRMQTSCYTVGQTTNCY